MWLPSSSRYHRRDLHHPPTAEVSGDADPPLLYLCESDEVLLLSESRTNDCALNVSSKGDMQRSIELFASACDNFGLIINTEKGVIVHKPPPDAACVAPQINVNGARL
ncbi:hypothetical protein SprV_0100389900 [Sparganum proliferum]